MENQTEKAFGMKTLITLLVGVISMIVIIPTIALIMNNVKPEEVKPEEYRLIINKNYNFEFDFDDDIISESTTLVDDLSGYDNMVSLLITQEYIVMTLSYSDESNRFNTLYLNDGVNDASYLFTYLDPVTNDKLYGTYDFSHIILIETSQVISPIYTPW